MQLKQFSGINLEDNIDLFDSYADKFQKLPMFYLTFHGAQELSIGILGAKKLEKHFMHVDDYFWVNFGQ